MLKKSLRRSIKICIAFPQSSINWWHLHKMNSLSVCLIRVFGASPHPLLAHSPWNSESKHNFVTSLLNFFKNVKCLPNLISVVATNSSVFLGTCFVDKDRDRSDDSCWLLALAGLFDKLPWYLGKSTRLSKWFIFRASRGCIWRGTQMVRGRIREMFLKYTGYAALLIYYMLGKFWHISLFHSFIACINKGGY